MHSKNVMMAILVILSMVLFTSTTTNALVISNENNITDVDLDVQHTHYTIKDDIVLLHSLVGHIGIPIPENVQAELNELRVENKQNQKLERLSAFPNRNINDNGHSNAYADFFECNEQAQIALSTHSENYRYWEAFFKRNTVDDTIAVSASNRLTKN